MVANVHIPKKWKKRTLTKNGGCKVFKKELESEVLCLLNFHKTKTGGSELTQRIAQH